jgi:FkbM family methyltransferase
MKMNLFKMANFLYKYLYPVYLPLYTGWKAFSDREERKLLRQLVKPGMIVADVGANIGIYTRFLSRLTGECGHVYAFEPSPENFARLRENVSEIKNVTPVQSAIGSTTGEITLYFSEDLNVDHHTYDSGDGRRKTSVSLICLDDYFKTGHRIDLIKIDVQGFEYSVLQGARRILKENPEIKIIMEYWPYGLKKAGTSPEALLQLISSMGFASRDVSDHSGVPFNGRYLETSREDEYCNLSISKQSGA